MKGVFRRMFPTLYDFLWRFKEFLRLGTSNKQWEKYYVARYPWLHEPSAILLDLKLSSHVDTILDLGCGSGRNFIPFDGKLKLWGIDIARAGQIRWVRPFTNLTYERCKVEQLTERLERGGIDLSHTFVFESGTLMYVSGEYQNRFLEACKKCGCKNIMFVDYPQGTEDGFDLKIPKDKFADVRPHPTDPKLWLYMLMEAS